MGSESTYFEVCVRRGDRHGELLARRYVKAESQRKAIHAVESWVLGEGIHAYGDITILARFALIGEAPPAPADEEVSDAP